MPIYEYVCLDCGTRFDSLRPMKDSDAPIECQKCNSEHTSRLLSVFFAQSSSGRIVAGGNGGACATCASGSCATCGN